MQTITFSGNHAFLFGKNGGGKSSIVEAIRWCLFGLADRPETEVRNAYYASSECQVELVLQASDGMWHIRRRLRPGTERSRLTITNPDGQEVLQSQIFPYLARMGPREGTHVIFAAQQATGRRPQADVSDFHKVLYSYLHLEEVPGLLERLENIIEEQKSVREDVASEIGEIEDGLRTKMSQVETSLEELLLNPPWSENEIPTRAETDNKIYSFAQEVAKLANESLASNLSAREVLEQTEQWYQKIATSSREELQKKLNEQKAKATNLENLLQTLNEAEENKVKAEGKISQLEKELTDVVKGQSLEDLRKKIELIEQQMQKSDSKLAIAKLTEVYCRSYSPTECPACLTKHDVESLYGNVKLSIEQGTPEQIKLAEELENLQGIYTKASELNNEINQLKTKIQIAVESYNDALSQAHILLVSLENLISSQEDIRIQLTSANNLVSTLETTLESTELRNTEWKQHTDALRSELRFHRYRDEQQRIQQQLTSGLEPIRDQLRELIELENTVHNIGETLRQAFNSAIDHALPHINKMMTEVYQRLTGQISFEQMYIQRTDTALGHNLQIRVGSERISGQLFDPEDVLNGQANSAIRLVPYFVFSQFQSEALELDLLLIDDPSQSFDTSHIDFLLQELAKAGSHAQLIVATHEDERFRPQINQFFSLGEYKIIRFTEFDIDKGPSFVIE